MYALTGESHMVEEGEHTITIDGEEYTYTGTDHRWLLFKVYAKHMANAGLFGMGYGGIGQASNSEECTYNHPNFIR